jgi:hypothetical protein
MTRGHFCERCGRDGQTYPVGERMLCQECAAVERGRRCYRCGGPGVVRCLANGGATVHVCRLCLHGLGRKNAD